jgi:hypothetical protein
MTVDRLAGSMVVSGQVGIGWEGSMAQKKAKAAPAARKTSGRNVPAARHVVRQEMAATSGTNDPGRLLREAAWSRMFGRVEAKNPFAR